ncbi:MAG: hypothetical protein COB85_03475 [Bacteroidetes bacterium]|nr:MAG: hypothetical protein COB85_03475 [Bacteroidota bacterium]
MKDKLAMLSEALRRRMDKKYVGVMLALILPPIVLFVYWKFNYAYMSIDKFMDFVELGDLYTILITRAVVVNLLVFFIFFWRKLNFAARGVLMATIGYTVVVAIVRFIM